MRIHVKLSTTLRDQVPGYDAAQGLWADVEHPASIRTLAEQLRIPMTDIKIVMRNGRHSELDAPLDDGDRIAFFPAVGGG